MTRVIEWLRDQEDIKVQERLASARMRREANEEDEGNRKREEEEEDRRSKAARTTTVEDSDLDLQDQWETPGNPADAGSRRACFRPVSTHTRTYESSVKPRPAAGAACAPGPRHPNLQ